MATNDTASILYLADYINPKLEHAHDIWAVDSSDGKFIGWDDRVSGFQPNEEAQATYRHLAIRSWKQWASVLRDIGATDNATHFESYADAAISAVRNNGATPWYAPFGWFARSDAINGNWSTPEEVAEMVSLSFNDSTVICSLSNFNTYFLLHALAINGYLDRALAIIHHCWDVMILLGATTTWETSKPDWDELLSPNDAVPGFDDGFTSLAHPWSSGATAWSSAWLLGVRPITAGFITYRIAPHISGEMTGIKGSFPLHSSFLTKDDVRDINDEENVIRVRVSSSKNKEMANICVQSAGGGRKGVLELSEVLVSRLLQTSDDKLREGKVYMSLTHTQRQSPSLSCSCLEVGEDDDQAAFSLPEELIFESQSYSGPLDLTGKRSRIGSITLETGACAHIQLSYTSSLLLSSLSSPLSSPPNPFPPPVRNATFIGRDEVTAGDWIGYYGSEGYFLVAYDGPNKHLISLPSWVNSITNPVGQALNGPWLDPTPDHDRRALLDPRNITGPRKIGQFCAIPPPADGWAPSLPFDVIVNTDAPVGFTYQYSFYFCDYDSRGRRQSVQLMDQITFSDISPTQMVHDFVGCVWLIWQYPRGVRIRLNWVRGVNEVMSAILFDLVKTE